MRLLGSYQSSLTAFHYQELRKLLETAIAAGDFSSGSTFDTSDLLKLQQQGQDFQNLPVASAGQRVTDDSLNRPLDLLRARFNALLQEAQDFDSKASVLMSILVKDSALIEQLLAAASLEAWADSLPQLKGSQRIVWDFGMGYGNVASDIDLIDPTTSVKYPSRPPIASFLNAMTSQNSIHTGLAAPGTIRQVAVKDLSWTSSVGGQIETLQGDAWTKFSLMSDRPLVNFRSPQVSVVLPSGLVNESFVVSGNLPEGSVPVFVRALFHPRRNQAAVTASDATTAVAVLAPVLPSTKIWVKVRHSAGNTTTGQLEFGAQFFDSTGTAVLDSLGNQVKVRIVVGPQGPGFQNSVFLDVPSEYPQIAKASLYTIITGNTGAAWAIDGVQLRTPMSISNGYDIQLDSVVLIPADHSILVQNGNDDLFFISDDGQFTAGDIGSVAYTVRFTELFPAYQCSVDQKNWSILTMLDSSRPYPDDAGSYPPLALGLDSQNKRTLLPLTDEIGNHLGMYIQMVKPLKQEMLLKVTTPADAPSVGCLATLELEFERPTYLNGLHLEPFTNFPATVEQIEVEGLTADTKQRVYGDSSFVLDRPVSVRFTRQMVRKAYVHFRQLNYSLKEHQVDPPDALRRDVLSSIQASLPFTIARSTPALPVTSSGAQYEFGAENIAGEDWQAQTPGVFVSGPLRTSNVPEIIRVDATVQGSPEIYLCFRAFDQAGNSKDLQVQGISLTNGSALVFPFSNGLNLGTVSYCDLFLKFIHRGALDLVERFSIQTTKV
jgi:hypothetical protein